MFVCVRGDRIGHVLDRRNHADCPNLNNFSKKPAAELKVRRGLGCLGVLCREVLLADLASVQSIHFPHPSIRRNC